MLLNTVIHSTVYSTVIQTQNEVAGPATTLTARYLRFKALGYSTISGSKLLGARCTSGRSISELAASIKAWDSFEASTRHPRLRLEDGVHDVLGLPGGSVLKGAPESGYANPQNPARGFVKA